MARSVSKDAILDAAEAMVNESGAANLTLDGVAERAGISKGGLMYTFPSKASLLQSMIGRLIDRIEESREQVRQEFNGGNQTELMVEIRVLARLDESGARSSAALLAAVANQPSLTEPFRDEMRRRLRERILSERNPNRSTILFLAALGLHLTGLLELPLLNATQRQQVYGELLRLAGDDAVTL